MIKTILLTLNPTRSLATDLAPVNAGVCLRRLQVCLTAINVVSVGPKSTPQNTEWPQLTSPIVLFGESPRHSKTVQYP
jgi:hypothetical protein